MGINTKKQKPEIENKKADDKKKPERDLRECMNCRYFWGNDSRCIENRKCSGEKKKQNKLQDEKKNSKCIGCPYVKNSTYCFPCMKDILGV